MNLPQKIPIPLGILLLVLIVGMGMILVDRLVAPWQNNPDTKPAHLQITNLTDTTFSIIWFTTKPTTGSLVVTTNQDTKRIFYDDRDTAGKMGKYTSHSITARDLSPNSSHTVVLSSNGIATDATDSINPIRTFPSLAEKPGILEPAFGVAAAADDTPAEGAIVTLSLEGSQTLSTLVKPSGSWIIPLNTIRTIGGTHFLPQAARHTETLRVQLGNELSTATTDTLNDAPVPTIVLGKSYDFRKQQGKMNNQPDIASNTTPPRVLGTQSSSLSLQQPADGSSLATAFPLFKGTGVPGKSLTISIGIIRPESASFTIPSDGVWRYTPKNPVGIGKQIVTVISDNSLSRPVAITHSFVILKDGTQVLGDATPSATLAPTETPAPTDIVEVPTPTVETPPVTGSFEPFMLMMSIGMIFLLGGAVAFGIK